MAMVVVVDSSLQADSQTKVAWSEGRVGGRLALFYIRQMNRVNFRNLVDMMTAL